MKLVDEVTDLLLVTWHRACPGCTCPEGEHISLPESPAPAQAFLSARSRHLGFSVVLLQSQPLGSNRLQSEYA